jgi:hypothetical protein
LLLGGHHTLEAYFDAYLDAAGIRDSGKSPLFRSAVWHSGTLTENAMHRLDARRMMQRRAAVMGLKVRITCHSFWATSITASMDAGGTLEHAQRMAAHESPHTTKLYDRTGDAITLDEVERIRLEGTESTTAASHAVCSFLGRVFLWPYDLRRVCAQPLSPRPSL